MYQFGGKQNIVKPKKSVPKKPKKSIPKKPKKSVKKPKKSTPKKPKKSVPKKSKKSVPKKSKKSAPKKSKKSAPKKSKKSVKSKKPIKIKKLKYNVSVSNKVKECKKEKIAIVMNEFKNKSLKKRNGEPVTNQRQAIAIALSVAKKECEKN